MNDKQKRLYDYLIRHKLGTFNSIANGRWTDDMRGMDMKDEAAAAGRYIDDVANEGVREMWMNGVDDDVTSLSRAEIRKVAEAAYLYALEKKKWRMTCSRDRIDKIISEAMDRVINAKENDESKLRDMIHRSVRSFSIDADNGMAEVSFSNEKVANSVINTWKKHWPVMDGYEILSVENLPMGKDFNSVFARKNGGTCRYRIRFRKIRKQ